jgi:hypothetical protein
MTGADVFVSEYDKRPGYREDEIAAMLENIGFTREEFERMSMRVILEAMVADPAFCKVAIRYLQEKFPRPPIVRVGPSDTARYPVVKESELMKRHAAENEDRDTTREFFDQAKLCWVRGGPIAVPRHVTVHPDDLPTFGPRREGAWETEYGVIFVHTSDQIAPGTFKLDYKKG